MSGVVARIALAGIRIALALVARAASTALVAALPAHDSRSGAAHLSMMRGRKPLQSQPRV